MAPKQKNSDKTNSKAKKSDKTDELTEADLDNVAGGAVQTSGSSKKKIPDAK
ncbi:MAG: hypothetical protein L6R45_11825 [Anaerolineae bacterium]|nr:hypothetical protein [Anaerolineae bacterium]